MKIDIKVKERVDIKQVIDHEKTQNGLISFKNVEERVLIMIAEYIYKGQYYKEQFEFKPEKLTQTRNFIIDKIKDNITEIKDKERAINYSETIELGV